MIGRLGDSALMLPRGGGPAGRGSGLDDGASAGEPVNDGRSESRVGEGSRPVGEGCVRGDRDGAVLLPLNQDLQKQLCASTVEFHVSEFVEHQQVDLAVAGDGASEVLLIGVFDEFVLEVGGERVFDPETLIRSRCVESSEEVALAGAGVTDEAEGLRAADPVAGGEGGGVDNRVRVEVEVPEPLFSREPGGFDAAE